VQKKEFDSEGISIEAASWVLQIDNGPFNKEDREALREWAGRSPAHALALKEFSSTWMSIDDVLSEANEIENNARPYSWWLPLAAIFNRPLFKVWAPVTAVLVIAFYYHSPSIIEPSPEAPNIVAAAVTYSTQVGEQAKFKLADGSFVHLNTGSMVKVEYQPARRLVHLLKGEAHFDVEPDSSRPFDVIAKQKQISAVGTAFVVRLTDIGLNITVTEGTVAVAPSVSGTPQSTGDETELLALLKPNEKMIFKRKNAVIAKVNKDEILRELSWRDGVLIFEGDSLGYVLKEVARYTDTKIILANHELEELRVGGLFQMGEINSLLKALEISFDLHAKRVDKTTIYLSRRAVSEEDG